MTASEAIAIMKKFRLYDIAELDSAVPEALAALEKQIPLKPRYIGNGFYRCPVCDNFVHDDQNYCPYCGQAIYWTEQEEE